MCEAAVHDQPVLMRQPTRASVERFSLRCTDKSCLSRWAVNHDKPIPQWVEQGGTPGSGAGAQQAAATGGHSLTMEQLTQQQQRRTLRREGRRRRVGSTPEEQT